MDTELLIKAGEQLKMFRKKELSSFS